MTIDSVTLGLLLCLGNLFMELGSARVDGLELREMVVEDADNLRKLFQIASVNRHFGFKRFSAYRVVRLVCLAERCRDAVDLLNHIGQVLVQVIQTIRELLRKLVPIIM